MFGLPGSQGGLSDLLRDSTEATHNFGNAANTNKGAHCTHDWLGQMGGIASGVCRWDKISFNFGIHDCNRYPGNYLAPEHLQLSEYESLLTRVVSTLQSTCPSTKLLYVTTTPVSTNATDPGQPGSTGLLISDVQAVNAAAKAIMARHGVPVLDMFEFVIAHCGVGYATCDWQGNGSVHFRPVGWQAMAAHLASAVVAL